MQKYLSNGTRRGKSNKIQTCQEVIKLCLPSSKLCFSSSKLCLGQDVNTPEMSENCCLTQDGDQSLIIHVKLEVKTSLQSSVGMVLKYLSCYGKYRGISLIHRSP